MSRTRMTIKKSSDEMDSNADFDAADFDAEKYVDSNFDDFEDGWGINLMNLEEITSTEEEMKKILQTLIDVADKKKKKMLEEKKQEEKKQQAKTENDEERNEEDEKNVKK